MGAVFCGESYAEDYKILTREIRKCRGLTDKPFGVNIMLMHPQADEIADIVIQENVKATIESLSGISVDAVNIHIQGVDYSESESIINESESDKE